MVINNIGKWLYRVYMYKPLFVNVSVSLIVSGVQPHMTSPPQREDRKLDILENIKFLSPKQKHAMETRSQHFIFTRIVHAVQQNQSELGLMMMEYLKVALD